ncbi:Transmembrane amino acid transporter protein family protein [Cryptosporidium meleagridis]|uniref:Transmembrane amino acid transporter protein family protein n=1 Tax=Cryptosporidium meleagridis TaxID=93969 RepID=A0A2P4Z2Y3_9CRYT|nr:Transmembrane amino acid transporter protein family protein [Cryptosporidium meleagridis]
MEAANDSFKYSSKAFATMTAGCIGSGVVFLTYGMKMAGLAVGISTLIICAIVSIVTHSIYVVGSLKLGAVDLSTLLMRVSAYKSIRSFLARRDAMKENKEDIEKLQKGQKMILTASEVEEMKGNMKFHFKSISIICFLSMAYAVPVYFILLRSFTQDLVTHAVFSFPQAKFLEYLKDEYLLSALYFLLVLPFATKSKVSELDFLGWFSVASFFTLAAVIVVRSVVFPYSGPMPPVTGEVHIWPAHGPLSAFKMFTFATYAFLCHCMVVPAVLNVSTCTYKRCIKVISASFTFLLVFSLALTISAYTTFGEATRDNITLNFSPCDIFMGFSRILSCISLCVIIPLFTVSICNFIVNDIGLINYMSDLAVEDVFQVIFDGDDDDKKKESRALKLTYVPSNPSIVLDELAGLLAKNKARAIESDGQEDFSTEAALKSMKNKEKFNIWRFLLSTAILLVSIFLSHVAKSCTQYVELFCGYIDAFTASIYPLFVYSIIWGRRKSFFTNFFVVLSCYISAIGPILSSIVTTYELITGVQT